MSQPIEFVVVDDDVHVVVAVVVDIVTVDIVVAVVGVGIIVGPRNQTLT